MEDDNKTNISTLHHLLFILKSSEEYIEGYISNIRRKLYFLYSKPIELTSKVEIDKLSVSMVKVTISPLNCIFMLMSFMSDFVERIQRDEFCKTNHKCGWHQKGCSTVWNFFFATNCDSPKKSVKLLGHEQRSDFHHNKNTPLSEGLWVFLWLFC